MRMTRFERLTTRTLPWGYRVAYVDNEVSQYVVLPIGIHWVARILHRFWEWSCLYRRSRLEKLISNAEWRGADREREAWEKVVGGRSLGQVERTLSDVMARMVGEALRREDLSGAFCAAIDSEVQDGHEHWRPKPKP